MYTVCCFLCGFILACIDFLYITRPHLFHLKCQIIRHCISFYLRVRLNWHLRSVHLDDEKILYEKKWFLHGYKSQGHLELYRLTEKLIIYCYPAFSSLLLAVKAQRICKWYTLYKIRVKKKQYLLFFAWITVLRRSGDLGCIPCHILMGRVHEKTQLQFTNGTDCMRNYRNHFCSHSQRDYIYVCYQIAFISLPECVTLNR